MTKIMQFIIIIIIYFKAQTLPPQTFDSGSVPVGKQPWYLPIVGSASFFFDNSCIKVYFHKNGEKEIP